MSLSVRSMESYAQKIVNESLRIDKKSDGKFESVRIGYNSTDPSCVDFALKVEEECWRVGAHTLMIPFSSNRERLRLSIVPDEALQEMSPMAKSLAKCVDTTIFIGEQDNPGWASSLHDRIRLTAPHRKLLRSILDRRKVKWLYLGWPVPGAAKYYGLPIKEFRRIFFNAIHHSFSSKLRDIVSYYKNELEGGKRVQIKDEDGTNLEFRIDDRPILTDEGVLTDEDIYKGDVGLNIPSGEVFVAPLETSAEGQILFDRVHISGFGGIKGLKLKFRKGKVRHFGADEGSEHFENFLKANTGDKDRIGEFGIGCNPGAEYTGGSIIVDEKIFGTLHIAIGSNTGSYHGKNRASSHLDMIKNMREGSMAIDGRMIMLNGKPVSSVD